MREKSEIAKIERELVLLGPTEVVCHPKIQRLCLCPYFNHPKGCPNYGRKKDCPPDAPLFTDVFEAKVHIAAVIFNFKDFLEMRREHRPDWTERALRNPRHWQGHLRSELRKFVSGETAIFNLEAMGVDVTETCRKIGLKLEWPPERVVCQIALIGQKKSG